MNPYLLIGSGVLLLAMMKKKGPGAATSGPGATNYGTGVVSPTTEEIAATLRSIAATYGNAIARNVERIYRLETASFTSGQFRLTNTAGMKALSLSWPFGWPKRGTVPEMFAEPVSMSENAGGGPFNWVAFKRFPDAAEYLAKFLQAYGNDPARWRTDRLDSPTAASYRAAVAAINPQYV